MKFTFTPKGVAALFLKTLKSDATNDEVELLGRVIEDAWKNGILDTLDKVKEEYIKTHGISTSGFISTINKMREDIKCLKRSS